MAKVSKEEGQQLAAQYNMKFFEAQVPASSVPIRKMLL